MHRILLYALVVGLLYLSWSSRTGTTLAAQAVSAGSPEFSRGDEAAPGGSSSIPTVRVGGSDAVDVHGRLEALVDRRGESGAVALAEFRAEAPLDAGRALEARLDNGVSVPPRAEASADRGALESQLVAGTADQLTAGRTRPGTGEPAVEQERDPISLVSLARVESLGPGLPSWSGLLDLALDPVSFGAASTGAAAGSASFETAWLCDDQGVLLARIQGLDGIGLSLEPGRPWLLQGRRLQWDPRGGVQGLSAREYRVVLYGNSMGSTWTGRLVLLSNQAARRAPARR